MPAESLHEAIKLLAENLPEGSEFTFSVEGGHLHLDILNLPQHKKGTGTLFLAKVLGEADRDGVVTTLHADPTDEPGDPDTYDLVRWYTRFGFEISDISPDGWIEMTRQARPFTGANGILAAYRDAATRDISWDEVREIIDNLPNRHRL